eukprot:g167.t1 g167   contig1:411927-416535(-)
MSSSSDDLALNDPVHVTTTDDPSPLEGIISHLGPVAFAPGSDWIGIRLTGPSVGKGKNDGSVKGTAYFECGGEKNGMFVKRSNVEKRTLTKLESLRLRRELEGAGSVSGAAKSGIVSPVRTTRSTRSTRSTSTASADSSAGGSTKSTTPKGLTDEADSKLSRIEMLRAKREALAKEREAKEKTPAKDVVSKEKTPVKTEPKEDTPAKKSEEEEKLADDSDGGGEAEDTPEGDADTDTTNNTNDDQQDEDTTTQPKVNLQTATPGYRAELARLQSVITSLRTDLKNKEAENASLQSSLDFMSKGAEQSTHDAVRMYAMGALALTEAKTPKGGGRRSMGVEQSPALRSLNEEMNEESGSESGSESDDGEDDDEENANEGVVNQAAAAVSQALVQRNNELMSQLSNLTSENNNLQHQLSESEERISNLSLRLEQSMDNYQSEKQARADDLTKYTADKITKLRAELTSLQRKNEELNNDKVELETTLEELVLDKEQIREEKELLEEQLDECKIDLESAQLELEDAKGQLAEGGGGDSGVAVVEEGEGGAAEGDAGADSGGETPEDSQDLTRSLTLQNTRLRAALIRLREQSEQERNDLQRQLKALQSDSSSKEEMQAELEALRSSHAKTLTEVKELKEIIDQTTSLEETIETLSDKMWSLEQENAELERTIRELEESAEIAAELEEVQGEELKMVMRDLEGRDALVRNLEEAIRMQRRREEDFQRYVGEFRSSVSTLKQEKAALLALAEGDQGKKSQLLATSQKALAQAAQLAANAAQARQRESEAAFDRIAARSATYLSQRLETLLPSGVVSAELAAIKGELSLAKVADKSAESLSTLELVFNKVIEKGSTGLSEFNTLSEGLHNLSDASSQQIAAMVHQTDFATMTIEAASDALRLMAAGNWPELLSPELSTDLGGVVAHSIAHLDLTLSEQLKLLKQDGVLSPLRSSLADLDQSVRNTRLELFSATDETGKTVIPEKWKPPGWEALKSLSLGRFACLGATAVISSAISPIEDSENEPPPPTLVNLAGVLESAKHSCNAMLDVCKKLSGLEISDTETLESLNELAGQYQSASSELFDYVKTTFTQQSVSIEDVDKCSPLLDEVLSITRKLSALLRKANIGEHKTSSFHQLSPEYGDAWGGITNIIAQVTSVDGDPEDVNYLMRARTVEQMLSDAVQNEPKLEVATSKIGSLEKNLASRSKEIAMQNSRIAELESLISKNANPMSPLKGRAPGSSATSADTHKLMEDLRVLQEALDVAHQEADAQAKEIKMLKDKSRTPRGIRQGASGRVTPKKSSIEETLSQFGQASASKAGGAASSTDLLLESISLETAVFRPALCSATQSASYWKAQAMGSALSKLTPLNVPAKPQASSTSTDVQALFGRDEESIANKFRCMEEVALASNEVRLAKASFSIVDLTDTDVSSRNQLNKERQKENVAESRLYDATMKYISYQSKINGSVAPVVPSSQVPLGRITLPCRDDTGFVSTLTVSKGELREFHSFLVQ